jgi:hypothetical protein
LAAKAGSLHTNIALTVLDKLLTIIHTVFERYCLLLAAAWRNMLLPL